MRHRALDWTGSNPSDPLTANRRQATTANWRDITLYMYTYDATSQLRIHGGEGDDRPLDWGQKKIIARPKDTHICKPPFAWRNVLKLTYSNLEFQIFFRGRTPGLPSSRGGKAGEGRRGEAEEREGRGSLGKGGEGREGTGEGRREGRNGVLGRVGEAMGARHWLCPPP